jgi:hypothetical protein
MAHLVPIAQCAHKSKNRNAHEIRPSKTMQILVKAAAFAIAVGRMSVRAFAMWCRPSQPSSPPPRQSFAARSFRGGRQAFARTAAVASHKMKKHYAAVLPGALPPSAGGAFNFSHI